MKQLVVFAALFFMCLSLQAQPVKIMLITGGHSYDTLQFFQLFNALDSIEYEHFPQPKANKAIAEGAAQNFDVLVFYDMWQPISEKEKQAYIDLTSQGKPFLFFHHALVSYQNWDEFEKIIGGRYVEKAEGIPQEKLSTYKHDVWVDIEVVDSQHSVTKGFHDFRLFDEVYGNYRISPDVTPLLKTSHPESSPVIGWENKYNNSTIVYLQPGHDSNAYNSPHFQKLILQAVNYLAGTQ
jgi:type 1 glutamine amidotransferase